MFDNETHRLALAVRQAVERHEGRMKELKESYDVAVGADPRGHFGGGDKTEESRTMAAARYLRVVCEADQQYREEMGAALAQFRADFEAVVVREGEEPVD
jgi:hypothetical protein